MYIEENYNDCSIIDTSWFYHNSIRDVSTTTVYIYIYLESSNAELDVNLDRRVWFTGLAYDADEKKRQPDQHNQPNQYKATSKDLDKPALLLSKVTWEGLKEDDTNHQLVLLHNYNKSHVTSHK